MVCRMEKEKRFRAEKRKGFGEKPEGQGLTYFIISRSKFISKGMRSTVRIWPSVYRVQPDQERGNDPHGKGRLASAPPVSVRRGGESGSV